MTLNLTDHEIHVLKIFISLDLDAVGLAPEHHSAVYSIKRKIRSQEHIAERSPQL